MQSQQEYMGKCYKHEGLQAAELTTCEISLEFLLNVSNENVQ